MPLPSLKRMRILSKHYPPKQRARDVKMVLDHLGEYPCRHRVLTERC